MFSFTNFEQGYKYSFRVLHFSLNMRFSNKNYEKIIIFPLLEMLFFFVSYPQILQVVSRLTIFLCKS